MEANVPAYLRSWSLELASRSERVRNLIGDAHWLSDGHHKEELLRDFLARYLPSSLRVSRGFIKAVSALELCSPEIDILITDARRDVPLFNEGGLQIVETSSVVAIVEVKTAFSKPKLKDAIASTARTGALLQTSRSKDEVYSLVHFYTGSHSLAGSLDTIEECIREVAASGREEGWFKPHCWPNAITVMGQFSAYLSSTGDDTVACRLFDTKDLSAACALSDLFGHIRSVSGGAALGGFDNLVESIQFDAPLRREMNA